MHEQEVEQTSTIPEEEDALLPDGWTEDTDLLATSDEDDPLATLTEEATPVASDAQAQGVPREEATEKAEITPTPNAPPDNSPDAQQAELERKARAYDALYDQQLKEKFRRIYEEQTTFGMSPAVARMIAANECDGKTYPLEDATETTNTTSAGTDFRTELQQLQSLYPDLTEMPQEVMTTYRAGSSLKDAYASYRIRQDAQTIAALRQENEALKRKETAPVTSVSHGGAVAEKRDLFLEGFDAEDD